MPSPDDQLLAAFESLPLPGQARLIEALRERYLKSVRVAREITVIGAYDQRFDDEAGVKRPLPPDEEAKIAAMDNREVVLAYLRSIPDDVLLHNYRVVQFRLLGDDTLWQVSACASIRREVGGWEEITADDVAPIPATPARGTDS